jgi:hypothetical protein
MACQLCVGLLARSPAAFGAGPSVLVAEDPPADVQHVRAISEVVKRYRSVVGDPPRIAPGALSPDPVVVEQRAQSIQLSLERAEKNESEALWDDCVREAVGAMGDAIELIGTTGEPRLLRELHIQAGVCMSLSQQPGGARPHFLAAALLDERPPTTGLHRQEAERLQAEVRDEILARPRGKVRIVTDPPGASVLIDGRTVEGSTPLEIDVRLGDHFVTFRRFRYEPHTERRFLQPLGLVRETLEPAHRLTLGVQLAELERQKAAPPPEEEVLLAQAVLARAEQLLLVSPGQPPASAYRLSLLDASSGRQVRQASLARSADDEATKHAVCDVLGEPCTVSASIPWYVWPLAGALLVGGIVATAVIVENRRDTRFCPPAGCR